MRVAVASIIRLWLLALIAVTSVQAASARGHAPAVDLMVICTGTGPVMVMVDENGEPTGGVMICPDYALNLLAHIATTDPDLAHHAAWHVVWRIPGDTKTAMRNAPATQARDPPMPI